VPPALRDAIGVMSAVLADAAADPVGTCGTNAEAWSDAAAAARRGVVRMSLEMRMVVTVEDR